MFNVCTCFLETHIEQLRVYRRIWVHLFSCLPYTPLNTSNYCMLLYYRLFQTHQLKVDIYNNMPSTVLPIVNFMTSGGQTESCQMTVRVLTGDHTGVDR